MEAKGEVSQRGTASAPTDRVRMGPIEAAIWEEEGEKGPLYTVKLTRNYKDAQDEWQSTPYLFASDLLLGAKALDLADTKIRRMRILREAKKRADQELPDIDSNEEDLPF